MMKFLVFGGTSEGRQIAETLSNNNISIHVSVATDYGQQVLKEKENLCILKGRLKVHEMESLCLKNNYDLIIDATHPFATEVSKNIKECASETNTPLIRFERNVDFSSNEKIIYAESPEQCRELLLKTEGKILLTTGSKDLHLFCENSDLRKRLVARVLPGMESLNMCYENKLEGKQIIAMQGPFSLNMNKVQIEDYGISVLVTKESGKTGGTDEKINAALEKGINCIVIKNPSFQTKEDLNPKLFFKFGSVNEIYSFIEKKFSVSILNRKKTTIYLIGTGMGNKENMTLEAAEKIINADYIFGAERLLSGINAKGKKYPYYLAKDVVPALRKSLESDSPIEEACILFSGDSGFFSGTLKMKKELNKIKNVETIILPGISSMSYLSAKCGIPYQDAEIISLHGIEKSIWQPQLLEAVSKAKKIFILTSGLTDMHEVGQLLLNYNRDAENKYKVAVGFQLSYDKEKVDVLDAEECLRLGAEGLYSALLFTELK